MRWNILFWGCFSKTLSTLRPPRALNDPGAAGWTYTAESGSSPLPAKTTTILFANVFPYMLQVVSFKVGFFFGWCGVVALIFIYLFTHDYRGRLYARVDELFICRIPFRKFRTTESTGD
ncbi:hypothetical protein EHS25_004743 [Saitozyma podzolica]|uniref:Uncharacterized protein n=1 Tax=Saitozyma podzolica TaxID=1890683 RepID=A0A427Y2N7_9TREE|nr:hypothetical protein EHS25_004743 [Saitozyma podzolica]